MCRALEIFSLLSLDTHTFKKMEFQPAEAKKFFSTVRKEMALLATSLPDGIMVKTFEDRMVTALLYLWPGRKKSQSEAPTFSFFIII